ncbi:MAG: hypothetical protein QM695_01680 [Micropruina sp.]
MFALYFDPAELDTLLEAPGYLRGVFFSRTEAEVALRGVATMAGDVRWLIVEEHLDERGWTDGFVTLRPDEGEVP